MSESNCKSCKTCKFLTLDLTVSSSVWLCGCSDDGNEFRLTKLDDQDNFTDGKFCRFYELDPNGDLNKKPENHIN